MDQHHGHAPSSRQGHAPLSPQAHTPSSRQGHAPLSPQAHTPSSRQAQAPSSRQGHAPPSPKAPPLPSADRPQAHVPSSELHRQGQPQAPQSSTIRQHRVPRPDHGQTRTVQIQDRDLPEGDLTGSILWPRAHTTMIDKNDIALAQNEVIMQKLFANEQLMKEQQKVTNRQFSQLFGLLQVMGEKAGVDPTILLNAKPSSKSTTTAKREAAKTIVTDIDLSLKVSITKASKKYLKEFPSLMLKTLTKKAKNEDYVGKWAAFVEKNLPDAQHVTGFISLHKAEREMLYKEMANEIRPSTKKINNAVLSDRSDEEGREEPTNAIRPSRTSKTRKSISPDHSVEEGSVRASRKRSRVEADAEPDDDTYDGSTLFVSEEEGDEDYDER
ncbi:hypothetical protein KCU93_g9275, partial [Aureobasidium melanogenum]